MRRLLTWDPSAFPAAGLPPRPASPEFVSRGDSGAFLVRRRGELGWRPMRLGVPLRYDEADLISAARIERLEDVERWRTLVNSRCAVPVRGYRWQTGDDWVSVAPGWAPGFHEADGAVIVAQAGGGAPVLLDTATALAWLAAPQWEVVPILEGRLAVAG